MPRPLKTPANRKDSNLWQSPSSGRWHWELRLTRRDGTEFRKAGNRATERAAREARDKAYAEFNNNEGRSEGHTVRTWSEYCLSDLWPNDSAHATQSNYRHWLTSRVYPILGSTRLDALTVEQLQLFFNRLQNGDVPSAAARTRTALASALTRAVEHGIIVSNPVRATKLRTARRVTLDDEGESARRILTMEEVDRLIRAAQDRNDPMLLPILLGGKLGLRFGECTGLNWSDVDLARNVVAVRRQRQNVRGKGLSIVPLKTTGSKRDIPIPASVRAVLASEKARATQQAVCVREGEPYSPQNGSVTLKSFIVSVEGFSGKDGLPAPTHHCLRASCLTYLANHANDGAGVRPAILMRIAGHTKIQTTMQYYVRASDDDMGAAMDSIG